PVIGQIQGDGAGTEKQRVVLEVLLELAGGKGLLCRSERTVTLAHYSAQLFAITGQGRVGSGCGIHIPLEIRRSPRCCCGTWPLNASAQGGGRCGRLGFPAWGDAHTTVK